MTNLLSPDEVADRLKCSTRTVLRELRAKNLRGSKLPQGWRVSEDDLDRYVAAHANVSRVRGGAA